MSEKTPRPLPTLNQLLDEARHHVMTDEEKEAQRQSWVRGEMALGESERGMTSVFPPAGEPSSAPPANLLSAEQIAQKLANVGGIERWRLILQEWLDSYIAIWKEEESIWRGAEEEVSPPSPREFLLTQRGYSGRETIVTSLDKLCADLEAYVEIVKAVKQGA